MTAPPGARGDDALAALQRLEAALENRDDSQERTRQRLAAARAEAERMLTAARAAGENAARRRRAELLAQAQTEATAVRAAGHAEAERLAARLSAERAQLIAALTRLVLEEEVEAHVGADDAAAHSRSPNRRRADSATSATARARPAD